MVDTSNMDPQYSERVAEELSGDVIGSNADCPYYPCHEDGQDCTFCFCPFYPCMDTDLGETVIGRKGTPVWSCKRCMLPHRPENAAAIHSALKGRWPCGDDELIGLLRGAKEVEMSSR